MIFSKWKINSFDYKNILYNNFIPLKSELLDRNMVLLQNYADKNFIIQFPPFNVLKFTKAKPRD